MFAVADAGVSSLSNLAVQFFAAASMSAQEFGWFSLGFVTAIWLIGLVRCLVGEIDLLRGGRARDARPLIATGLIGGLLVVIGLAVTLMAIGTGSEALGWIAFVCLTAPALLLQDTLRFRVFRQRSPHLALLSDASWLAFVLIAFFVLRGRTLDAGDAYGLWVAGSLIGALCILPRVIRRGHLREGMRWFPENASLAKPISAEYLLISTVPLLVNFLMAGLVGLEAVAGYRIAQMIFGVAAVVASGLNSALAPVMSESRSARDIRSWLESQTAVVVALCVALLGAAVLAPDSWGAHLGASWAQAQPFLLPAAIHGLSNGVGIPNGTTMRLLGLARTSLVIRLWQLPCTVVAVLTLAWLYGAVGAAWGLTSVVFLGLLVRATIVRRHLALPDVRQHIREQGPAGVLGNKGVHG
jgi:O-antigen/teichoic acid export membrane protein